jgi:hypothetical protein
MLDLACFTGYTIRMKRLLFLLIFGTCAGIFNLYAQMEKTFSFGVTVNMLWQDFSGKSWQTNENQSCSMFLPGLYYDYHYFLKNIPVGLYAGGSLYFTSKMNYNGKDVSILGMGYQFVLGPVFYVNISERIRIVSGIGFHLSMVFTFAMESWTDDALNNYDLPEYSIWQVWDGMGIGGKINIDFVITESLCFEIGSAFAYDFFSSQENYRGVHILPHVGITIEK